MPEGVPSMETGSMSADILVFLFGAISTCSVALVFGLKWQLDGRRVYDLAWTGALACYGVGIGLVTAHMATGSRVAADLATALFWVFAGLMVFGNLAFEGRRVPSLAVSVVALACAAISILFHLAESPHGIAIFGIVSAVLFLWTGWVLRRLPSIGRFALAIFALRALLLLVRPFLVGTPLILPFSIGSYTVNFLMGATLVAGSLFYSRQQLLASKERLRETNAALLAHEAELKETNWLLEEQALRLERLGSDYATALERAEQANRAKDSFISNMNHEFRTPLNAVLGFSELVRQIAEQKGESRMKEYADYAFEGGQAMLRNVNRILEFVALDSGDRQADLAPFDPRAAIQAEIRALADMAKAKRLQIVAQLDESPDAWAGDERGFRAIVDELLRNALKAAPDSSAVTVRVAAQDEELLLQIADTGNGLSDAFLSSVGESFNIHEHVLHRGGETQGVGLGLCIAARYAKLMGGALRLDRNQPQGTVARVVLSAA
jgi:signal transduction histidine kinase